MRTYKNYPEKDCKSNQLPTETAEQNSISNLETEKTMGAEKFLVEVVNVEGNDFWEVIIRYEDSVEMLKKRCNITNPQEQKLLIEDAEKFYRLDSKSLDGLRKKLNDKTDGMADGTADDNKAQNTLSPDDSDDTDGIFPGKISDAPATPLLKIADDAELFHDPDGNAYAWVEVNGHKEVKTLGDDFKKYLRKEYYNRHHATPPEGALNDAISSLQAKAQYDGPEREVFLRCAEHKEKVYIDLCNEFWQVIEVDDAGWRILHESPVPFRRTKSMAALPTPIKGGDIEDLRELLNLKDEDWILVKAWLISALNPKGPYPILAVQGEQGSAKSSTCKILKSLVDPSTAPLRVMPKDTRNLAIASNNAWNLAYDNISTISGEVSDALCRLSTGGGFATRRLYEDTDETIINAQRPIILNGINDVARRSDLLDRCITLCLPRIEAKDRKTERKLEEEFEAIKGEVFAVLLSGLSEAIKNLPLVSLEEPPRMADFAVLATAAEPALGLKDGEFMEAYSKNRHDSSDAALEASPISQPLLDFIDECFDWSGTATELLSALENKADERSRAGSRWPRSPSSLSKALKRIAPNLREAGLNVEHNRRGQHGKRVWEISKKKGGKMPSVSSAPSPRD